MRWAALILVVAAGCHHDPAGSPPTHADTLAAFDIRAHDGTILVPAGDILEYEWATHTMRWHPGVKERLYHSLVAELVLGSPFTVCVDGRPIYGGKFTTWSSSYSQDAVVILLDGQWDERGQFVPDKDVAHLELGYPTRKYFTGQDPRWDEAIRRTLEEVGKLK